MSGMKHLIVKGVLALFAFLLVVFTVYITKDNEKLVLEEKLGVETEIEKEEPVELDSDKDETVMVDIKGAVIYPGVYQVDPNARVNDVVALAGGITDEADTFSVNLAERVYDEMSILVLEKGEENSVPLETTSTSPKVKINIATKEEIMTLPGIGPSKAEAIIQYREENGRFSSPEDLLSVSGIGEKTLEKLMDYIQIP